VGVKDWDFQLWIIIMSEFALDVKQVEGEVFADLNG
jgi:hypothetical protein